VEISPLYRGRARRTDGDGFRRIRSGYRDVIIHPVAERHHTGVVDGNVLMRPEVSAADCQDVIDPRAGHITDGIPRLAVGNLDDH